MSGLNDDNGTPGRRTDSVLSLKFDGPWLDGAVVVLKELRRELASEGITEASYLLGVAALSLEEELMRRKVKSEAGEASPG